MALVVSRLVTSAFAAVMAFGKDSRSCGFLNLELACDPETWFHFEATFWLS
jgi:hypothetical protein